MHGALGMRDIGQMQVHIGFQPGDWFVAYIDPLHMRWDHNKFRIEAEINKLGFETFAPCEERTGVKRGKRVKIVTPAFGPYLFVKFDRFSDEWGKLRGFDPKDGTGISGFVCLLQNGGKPSPVPEILIDRLKRAMEAGLFGTKPFEAGTAVEIMEGPFAGFFGKIKSVSRQYRAKVLLNMLGDLEIDPCFLRKM